MNVEEKPKFVKMKFPVSVVLLKFVVRVGIDVHGKCRRAHMDLIRNEANRMGRPGIVAKSGQTDETIMKRGYAELVWSNRRNAIRYQKRIVRALGQRITIQRLRRRKRH